MKKIISPKVMRESERALFEKGGARSIYMMENAAHALAAYITANYGAHRRIYFACGTGGNGGDGFACARILSAQNECALFLTQAPTTPDAIENLARARALNLPVVDLSAASPPAADGENDAPEIGSLYVPGEPNAEPGSLYVPNEPNTEPDAPEQLGAKLSAPDLWVDALFGTGLSRAPQGAAAALIRRMNRDRARGAKIVAADVPSGLNAQTGHAYAPCVFADATVTFQYAKTGLLLNDGLDACGKRITADIGFPEGAFTRFDAIALEPSDVKPLLPARPRNIHKGACGHVLIIAGSTGMSGAAAMCALAALRSGAGLVSIACIESIVPILQALAPNAMCIPLKERDGAIAGDALPALRDALEGKQAIVCGCGLSRRASLSVVELALRSGLPAVIDADALNLIAAHPHLQPLLRPHHIMTPHPGEAKRLLEASCKANPAAPHRETESGALAGLLADPVACARALTRLGATVLLKGATSVIAGVAVQSENPEDEAKSPSGALSVWLSESGGCGMARGGSGDILSGILGALLAERSARTPALTAALASELHGLAGERAQLKYGARAMNALDILEFLPEVFPL